MLTHHLPIFAGVFKRGVSPSFVLSPSRIKGRGIKGVDFF
jgi:hypothetical protein